MIETAKRLLHLTICSILLAVLLFMPSCKSDVPEGILDEQTMEDVLYDYHMAQVLSDNVSARNITNETKVKYNKHYYIKSVLNKYNLTQQQFDQSLEYYTRHSDALYDIYNRLNERISAEAGTSAGRGNSPYGNMTSSDTTDIWQGPRSYLLTSTGQNCLTFEQKADTSLRRGDRLMLHFRTNWMYREGAKRGVAQLCLVYADDSVTVASSSFSNSTQQDVTISITRDSLVAVRTFIYQQAPWSARPKLLDLREVSLVRLRDKEAKSDTVPQQPEITATEDLPRPTAEQLLRDSLLNSDSIRRNQHHFK